MDTIGEFELRNRSEDLMNALEDGKSFIIARDGVPIGVLRPCRRPKVVTSAELMERARRLPPGDDEEMRREAEEHFGSDRLGEDDDPWERARGRAVGP